MCPPARNFRCPYCRTGVPYSAWLDTTLCVTAVFYLHTNNQIEICDLCYEHIRDSQERRSYELIARHYFHIGYEEHFEICSLCNVIIPLSRPYFECYTFRLLRDDFADYLQRTGDDPYDSADSTVITISQTTL